MTPARWEGLAHRVGEGLGAKGLRWWGAERQGEGLGALLVLEREGDHPGAGSGLRSQGKPCRCSALAGPQALTGALAAVVVMVGMWGQD